MYGRGVPIKSDDTDNPLAETGNTHEGGGEGSSDIRPISIVQEMKRSYLDYAMSVIVSRALPDVRDGLKPVHRRILYSMHESGYEWNKPYRKSARVVGDVMGKYHPHGDSAIYDALVRMAQDFSMRLPLIDGQGNFGSVDGDPPAAMRYTEIRLKKVAQAAAGRPRQGHGRFRGQLRRLRAGADGAARALPQPAGQRRGRHRRGHGHQHSAPQSGRGDRRLHGLSGQSVHHHRRTHRDRARPGFSDGRPDPWAAPAPARPITRGAAPSSCAAGWHVETIRKDREALVITEIPYQVNKASMVEKIGELVREKKIEGIAEVRDESDREGYRVVVELRRDAMADVVLNQLYRFTALQSTFGCNMVALNGGRPELMNLRDMISAFTQFREVVVSRRTKHLLTKARERAHILVGLAIAVANIDEVIKLIRTAPDPATAREQLMTPRLARRRTSRRSWR